MKVGCRIVSFIIFIVAVIFLGGIFIEYCNNIVLEHFTEWITAIMAIIGVFIAIGALYVYKNQADISEVSNLMVTWQEHNRIMADINSCDEVKRPLKYFELIMFFERICTLYNEIWIENTKMKNRFNALYKETIEANIRKHFWESFKYLFNNKRYIYIYEYGLKNLFLYFENENFEDISHKRKYVIKTKIESEKNKVENLIKKFETNSFKQAIADTLFIYREDRDTPDMRNYLSNLSFTEDEINILLE